MSEPIERNINTTLTNAIELNNQIVIDDEQGRIIEVRDNDLQINFEYDNVEEKHEAYDFLEGPHNDLIRINDTFLEEKENSFPQINVNNINAVEIRDLQLGREEYNYDAEGHLISHNVYYYSQNTNLLFQNQVSIAFNNTENHEHLDNQTLKNIINKI